MERPFRLRGRTVAGVDEAGRGPLAGPVVAAAVILDPDRTPDGLDDSKKLSPAARSALFPRIVRSARAVGVGLASAGEIDEGNILAAARTAMIRAVRALPEPPDWAAVDGRRLTGFPIPQIAVVGGDRLVPSIAAASVVAKVLRDRLMEALDRLLPVYGFAGHKGYPTEDHAEAIRERGASAVHRATFHVPCAPGERR
ncbi:MAG: ribonuclease HII [Candidatus Eisenbacteria bacterium]|nr:ribonuclease HII [Candidatus Eisenbacteria bacterium]